MKKLIFISALIFCVFNTNAQKLSESNISYKWQQPNQSSDIISNNMHEIGGFGIAFTTGGIWYKLSGKKRWLSIIMSTAFGTLVGIGKEGLDDSKGFEFDWDDVFDTSKGALVGAISFDILSNNHRKRKAQHK